MSGTAEVAVGSVIFGQGRPFVLIAGPCAIESRDHALGMAEALVGLTGPLGIPLVYKSSFDKANRTSAASARGIGMEAGLAILDEVRTTCVPMHAALALARADALVLRLTATAPAGDHPTGLSVREREVLRLVAEGMTDAEVADRLSISPRTVGQHLRSVYNKLGVPSRAAATRFAVEHDLV